MALMAHCGASCNCSIAAMFCWIFAFRLFTRCNLLGFEEHVLGESSELANNIDLPVCVMDGVGLMLSSSAVMFNCIAILAMPMMPHYQSSFSSIFGRFWNKLKRKQGNATSYFELEDDDREGKGKIEGNNRSQIKKL